MTDAALYIFYQEGLLLRAYLSTLGVFNGILQSCVRALTSERMVCSKCSSVCKVSSSVSEFPHLLIIYLNHLYADQGLPSNTTVDDVSRLVEPMVSYNTSSAGLLHSPKKKLVKEMHAFRSCYNNLHQACG